MDPARGTSPWVGLCRQRGSCEREEGLWLQIRIVWRLVRSGLGVLGVQRKTPLMILLVSPAKACLREVLHGDNIVASAISGPCKQLITLGLSV